jgi:L-aspartate oxidase
VEPLRCPREDEAAGVRRVVRDIAWERVGIVRDGPGLRGAVERLGELWRGGPERAEPTRAAVEAANLGTVAWLTARAASLREESRGGHYRSDFPARDDEHWAVHSLQRPGEKTVQTLPRGAGGTP